LFQKLPFSSFIKSHIPFLSLFFPFFPASKNIRIKGEKKIEKEEKKRREKMCPEDKHTAIRPT